MTNPIALCIEYLSERLPGIQVSSEIPPAVVGAQAPGGAYVQVSQIGCTSRDFIVYPIMLLTCWNDTDAHAYELAQTCYEILAELALDDEYLSACELQSMSRSEWAANGHARYTVQIKLTINEL